jgi:L-fuconolactonase
MIIDAHHHVWRLDRGDYAFPAKGDPVLYRDFMPGDLAPILERAGVGRTVLVQATDTIEETGFLLEHAAATPFVAGVVGWWDPRSPDCTDRLRALRHAGRLVGVRPMLQKYDDVDWLLAPAAQDDLARMAGLGWAFDALVDARHLAVVAQLCLRLPNLRVVIDHMGKPWRLPDLWEHWTAGMERLAQCPNCWVKVSGFPFAAGSAGECGRLDRLLARLTQWFGTERLVWGSDWPVVEREGGYGQALQAMQARLAPHARPAVFGRNAATLYALDGPAG